MLQLKIGVLSLLLIKSANGPWSQDEIQNHINNLELRAIYFRLKSVCNDYCNTHFCVLTGDTCAVSYINSFGKCRSHNTVKRDSWMCSLERNNWLTVAHFPGKYSTSADFLSKNINNNSKWKINTDIFKYILAELVYTPEIDLFASRLNYQFKPYIYFKSDPQCFAVHAFSLPAWATWNLYAFPSFSIINLVLQKNASDNTTGLIILPNWPTQPRS